MQAILTEIISLLTGGITGIASGIGGGLTSLVQDIFLSGEGDAQTLSVFGAVIVIFAGISLAIGLSRLVVKWVSSLGGNRL